MDDNKEGILLNAIEHPRGKIKYPRRYLKRLSREYWPENPQAIEIIEIELNDTTSKGLYWSALNE